MKRILLLCLVLLLLCTCALADGTVYTGTVVSARSAWVLAPGDGIICDVPLQPGDRIAAKDSVASLLTTTVFSETAGTVRLMTEVGASVETAASRFGAVAYVEPDVRWVISASTGNAYDKIENFIIHPGETVYFRCLTNNYEHKGEGIVTVVEDASYTIEVTGGEFERGETVYIYRDDDFSATERIGKGTAALQGPVAYTGSGTVAEIIVADGAHVTPGTPLFTTTAANAYDQAMTSPVSGVVAAVSVTPGTSVTRGTLVAEIYPDEAMRLAVTAEEDELSALTSGTQVLLNFANGHETLGTVEGVGGLQDESGLFLVYVLFPPDECIAYGMTAEVSIQ